MCTRITPLLFYGGMSQDAQAIPKPSATLLSSDLLLSMQLTHGTPTLPEAFSSSKMFNVEQQDRHLRLQDHKQYHPDDC